jgi:hypothetical protein
MGFIGLTCKKTIDEITSNLNVNSTIQLTLILEISKLQLLQLFC